VRENAFEAKVIMLRVCGVVFFVVIGFSMFLMKS